MLVDVVVVAKMFCEKRFRKRRAFDPREYVTSESGPTSPATCNLNDVGEETPTPTLPDANTFKYEDPEDEATLNASFVPALPCILNVTVDDVALTPATAPLSANILVPIAPDPVHLARYPLIPDPVTPEALLSTHLVDVPVD
jgi:hypothetical protein